MKNLWKAILFAVAAYFAFKLWQAFKKVENVGEAATEAAKDTVLAPANTVSTVAAAGAFVWDVLSGKGWKDSAEIFRGTTGVIWD